MNGIFCVNDEKMEEIGEIEDHDQNSLLGESEMLFWCLSIKWITLQEF